MVARLDADTALEHPNRALLLSIVEADPGLTFRAVVARSGVAAGTVRHHLTILQRSGLLRQEFLGGRSAILPAGDRRDAAKLAVLREPGMKDLRERIAAAGCMTQGQVLDAMTPWPRSTTQHRLDRLVKAGVLGARWQGRYRVYEVAEPRPPSLPL